MLQIILASMLSGLVLFVQLVHYPMFIEYNREDFPRIMREHQRRTSWMVVPLMLLELGVAILQFQTQLFYLAAFFFLAMVWLSTFFLQVPCHRVLEQGWNQQAYQKLVSTNWFRTLAWIFRLVCLLFLKRV